MQSREQQFGFSRARRVTKSSDFDVAFKRGRVVSDQVLVLHVFRNDLETCRLGLSISKRVGCAPVRNRWKRLIREAFRLNRSLLPAGVDIIARPRKGAVADFQPIQHSLLRLCARAAR